jgi:hypothetical protein
MLLEVVACEEVPRSRRETSRTSSFAHPSSASKSDFHTYANTITTHTLDICERPSSVRTCRRIPFFSYAVDIDLDLREFGDLPQALCQNLRSRRAARQIRLPPPTTNHSHTARRSRRDIEHTRPLAPATNCQYVEYGHAILTSTPSSDADPPLVKAKHGYAGDRTRW